MTSAGSLFKWLDETFPGRTFSQWEALAENSPPGAGGLTLLPYFAGERTPVNNPKARGVLFGITLRNTPGDVYKAFQEALGYGVRHNLEALQEEAGTGAKRILAIGGIAASRSLIQVISDISGCPQLVPRNKTGACYGDAFLAALGSGYFSALSDIAGWVSYECEIQPRPEYAEFYARGFEQFKALYSALEQYM